MAVDDKNRDKKLQYDINREAAKISALSPEKQMNTSTLLTNKYYLSIKEE